MKTIFFLCLICICSTAHSQTKGNALKEFPADKDLLQRFYLIGDIGEEPDEKTPLEALNNFMKSSNNKVQKEKSFLIFLGDNFSGKKFWPGEIDGGDIPGQSVFIPGEKDWSINGIDGLKEIENYLDEIFEVNELTIPTPGCGFSFVDISDDVHLILLDSQWFLEDWDDHPLINDDCPEIKTRSAFFEEIETELKKNQNKTTIIALHHPLISNGPHGGKFGWSSYINPENRTIPLPIFGQVINLIKTSGGTSIQDANNPVYSSYIDRIKTLSGKWGKVIFVSGHDHSLQYLEEGQIKQIISGSGATTSYSRKGGRSLFAEDKRGFAVVDVFSDGSSWARFYDDNIDQAGLLYQTEIFPKNTTFNTDSLPSEFPERIKSSVYHEDETDKTNFYKALWGDRYRELYELDIELPIADLDTLYGGLTPMRMGGGNQTNSLRVRDTLEREYNFRMLRKDAVQFLQATAYKNKPVAAAFEKTFAEEMIQDFYTASHPFAFLAVPVLADAAGVLHTNPEIYYLPKQPELRDYNKVHGNEIYMIEERPEEHWLGHKSFGAPNHDIQSTAGMFDRLRRDEKYALDEKAYIRARIFDMLIGDWDRHNDQWRWAEIELENENRIFKPIPRDRDQAFSNFDGAIFNNLRGVIGFLNQFGYYSEDIKDVEWFNRSALNLDRSLLQNSGKTEWLEQANELQEAIDDDIVRKAFQRLPGETRGEMTEELIQKVLGRRDNLTQIVGRYYEEISKVALITGTDKDDFIDIRRLADGNTEVKILRNKDGQRDEIVNQRIYDREETKEVWVYGLDDDDVFTVSGKNQDSTIKLKLIGGQNNDIYNLEQGKGVKVYDHRTKPNTIQNNKGAKIFLTDNYDINVFNKDLKISNKNSFLPYAGFNPDDGIILGFRNQYTVNNLVRKPFTSQHTFSGGYFFATRGFEVSYQGEFAHAERQFNLTIGANYSSPRNTINYFGTGNETRNLTEEFSRDYNRVRVSTLGAEVGLVKRSPSGNSIMATALLEGIKVEDTPERFITALFPDDAEVFERKYYLGIEGRYTYESYDNELNPAQGLAVGLGIGTKSEIGNLSRPFFFVNPNFELFTPLTTNRKLVLRVRSRGEMNFGENYNFYHAATLGGEDGLRGFRHERFTGSKAFSAGTDFRYSFNPIPNNFLPVQLGILSGYDVGRVWVANQDSKVWHQSYGGGFWITLAQAAAADFNLFHSKEGFRFSFGFTFSL